MATSIYHKSYKTFRGVDFSSERSACDETRFNYLVNMWRDYHSESGAAIETSPGFRKLFGCDGGKINGMHFLPSLASGDIGKLIVHRGTGLHVCTLNAGETGLEATAETEVVGASMADARSQSVLHRDRLYIVDGRKYFSVSETDNGAFAADEDDFYVPTTYLNGEPYEQRNLLTDEFVEKYSQIGLKMDFTVFLHEMVLVSDVRDLSLSVNGITLWWRFAKDPTFNFNHGNESYNVTEVLDAEGNDVKEKTKAHDSYDFYNDAYTVGRGKYCFYDGFDENQTVQEHEWYYYVDEKGDYYPLVFAYENICRQIYLEREKAEAGKEIEFVFPITSGGYVTGFTLRNFDGMAEEGEAQVFADLPLVISGFADPQKFNKVGDFRDVLTGNPDFSDGYTGTALDAINGCTLITEFDGRIFLSGNPKLPNSVFYTQRDLTGYNNPFYIGAYNYLNDGTGHTPITAMMTTPTHLIVLKDDVAQGASIYYHTAQDNPSSDKVTADLQPRIYPRENGVPGLGCLGAACNFRDDPVFISPHGLEAVGKSQVNLERTIVHRSSYVDAFLRNEDLRNASMAEWDGYLAILVPGGHMYLADSREMYRHRLGGYEYEWYFWDDIGTWTGTKNRYYYVTSDEEGELEINGVTYTLASQENEGFVPDEIEPCTVKAEDGITRYYVIEGEYAYPCDTSGEQIGGSFREATALLSVDGRLLFGTSDGSICVFNTDRRDENHYIPPEDYTHCGRRYLSGCATKSDSCGRENVTKTTARGSVVLKTKAFPYALITVKVRTNVTAWKEVDKVYGGENDFDHTDFSRFTFNPSAECLSVVNEHERKWVEKQFYIFTECWESPFGIVGLSYDYSIAGKVRMR